MHILDIAVKDLLQVLRDKKSVLFLVIMPILFTLFFGFIFNPANQPEDTRLPVAVINQDQGAALSQSLVTLLENSNTLRLVALTDGQTAEPGSLVEEGDLAAALVIPTGFSQDTLAGNQVPVTVIVDQASNNGHGAYMTLQTIVSRVLGMAQTAEISAQAMEQQQPFADEAERQAYKAEAIELASEAWQHPSIVLQAEGTGSSDETDSATAVSPYAQSSPGMIVQFTIYGLMTAGMVLVLERKSGTLARLLTTPVTRVQIIAGKILAMFILVFVQEIILIAVGQFVLRVDYLRSPLALLLLMSSVALWAASLGLLISAVSQGEEQVIMWSLIAMFVLAAMGGAWFPLDVAGKTFAAIGHVLPTAWTMDGFQNIIVRGQGLEGVYLPALVLMGYTVVCFGLAVWRFKFQ